MSKPARPPLLLLALLAPLACAHLSGKGGSLDDAQRTATAFLRVLRWQGVRDTAALVVPEQREVYLERIGRDHLEDHLKVTEFELREVERAPDGMKATARADLSWYLEPEVTVKKAPVVLRLAWRGGWLVEAVEGGPLELPALPEAPAPDAGG